MEASPTFRMARLQCGACLSTGANTERYKSDFRSQMLAGRWADALVGITDCRRSYQIPVITEPQH
jgi:hypothetical protein